MSHQAHHTQFMVQRLRAMGLNVQYEEAALYAEGRLSLSPTPFETLGKPLRTESVRFYTLGHNRLKFFSPAPFFDLPALDVSRCQSVAQLEVALRCAWATRIRDLRRAQDQLTKLGTHSRPARSGTELLLSVTGLGGPPAHVASAREIHLPSSGPLSSVSLAKPSERRFSLSPDVEHSSDLDIGLTQSMETLGRRHAHTRRTAPITRSAQQEGGASSLIDAHRVLVLDRDRETLTAVQSLMLPKGFQVDAFQDPERALAAFGQRSYDLVLAAASMPRLDGREFNALVQDLPGVAQLPVVLMDPRATASKRREALEAGLAGYLSKPLIWSEVGRGLEDLLRNVTVRRFARFAAQLQVRPDAEEPSVRDIADEIARGGFRLRSNRDLIPDTIERYSIKLPHLPRVLSVEGQVVNRLTVPGDAQVLAGIRVIRFLDDREPDWIRLIETLVRKTSPREKS